eukprot:TRINITY_DN5889_c0_g1_i1.p1 TRINITY_DN5889_c0_g1~~TRINITY_DN5889_c0_g1_i1.p1  ORF type:complete len:772 (-),score=149.97 TRINITY_DN5889_c0_g1_i1:57-2372(-)
MRTAGYPAATGVKRSGRTPPPPAQDESCAAAAAAPALPSATPVQARSHSLRRHASEPVIGSDRGASSASHAAAAALQKRIAPGGCLPVPAQEAVTASDGARNSSNSGAEASVNDSTAPIVTASPGQPVRGAHVDATRRSARTPPRGDAVAASSAPSANVFPAPTPAKEAVLQRRRVAALSPAPSNTTPRRASVGGDVAGPVGGGSSGSTAKGTATSRFVTPTRRQSTPLLAPTAQAPRQRVGEGLGSHGGVTPPRSRGAGNGTGGDGNIGNLPYPRSGGGCRLNSGPAIRGVGTVGGSGGGGGGTCDGTETTPRGLGNNVTPRSSGQNAVTPRSSARVGAVATPVRRDVGGGGAGMRPGTRAVTSVGGGGGPVPRRVTVTSAVGARRGGGGGGGGGVAYPGQCGGGVGGAERQPTYAQRQAAAANNVKDQSQAELEKKAQRLRQTSILLPAPVLTLPEKSVSSQRSLCRRAVAVVGAKGTNGADGKEAVLEAYAKVVIGADVEADAETEAEAEPEAEAEILAAAKLTGMGPSTASLRSLGANAGVVSQAVGDGCRRFQPPVEASPKVATRGAAQRQTTPVHARAGGLTPPRTRGNPERHGPPSREKADIVPCADAPCQVFDMSLNGSLTSGGASDEDGESWSPRQDGSTGESVGKAPGTVLAATAAAAAKGFADEEIAPLLRQILLENAQLRNAFGAARKRISDLEEEQQRFLGEGVFDLVNAATQAQTEGRDGPSIGNPGGGTIPSPEAELSSHSRMLSPSRRASSLPKH